MKKGLPFSLAIAIMKISIIPAIILMFALCAHAGISVGQEVLNRKITVDIKNRDVAYAFDKLSHEAHVKFIYSPEIIKATRKLTLKENNKELHLILDKLLKSLGLKYEYVNDYILVTKKKEEASAIDQPELLTQPEQEIKSIRGTVKNAKGEELTGVSVLEKGTHNATTTDAGGKFQISVTDENAVLVFTYIGFTAQEVSVGNNTFLDIKLVEESKALNEVVVVAYGTSTRKNNTGAIQSLNAKELQDEPVAQLTQKLQGKLSGVQITQTTGTPGAGMSVRIRGAGSISAGTNPLYVVDGLPIEGDISNINPDEIENISILKDAAATALYGSRATNGVVLLTTKHAKKGQSIVSLNVYAGVQSLPQKGRPDMMNAQEFAQYQKEIAEQKGQTVDPAYANPSQYGEGTNWYDILFRNAQIQNYSITIASSKDKTNSSVTVGYFNQDGVLLNSNYKRYSLRSNTDYQLNDFIKIGFNAAPSVSVSHSPQADGVWYNQPSIIEGAILTTPLAPYKNADGSIPLTATGPGLFPNPNWYNVLNVVKRATTVNRVLSNAYIEVTPLKGLTYKSSINIDLNQTLFNNFNPSTAGKLFAAPPQPITAVNQNQLYYTWLTENILTYKKDLGQHHFDVLGGFTAQKYRLQSSITNASDFPDDLVQTLNAAKTTITTSDIQEWSLVSYIGRLNYDFAGKYLVSGSIRRDGSSRFGSDNKYGNFPSASVGWIVTKEKFMESIPVVSFFKIRGSYGSTGNNNIGNYTQYANVSSTNYAFDGSVVSGRSATSLANNQLGWEKSTTVDVGAEFGFLNDRISFTYDYYSRNTNNLLYSVDVPSSSGFSSLITNIGKIKFWGHEFSITTQNMVDKFKWSTNFNISFNRNKVLQLGTANAAIYGDNTITEVGKPIGQLYGFVFEGLNYTQADLQKYPQYIGAAVGTARFKDVNGDGTVTFDNNDKAIIGDPTPKFVYGITNNFSYKNFDLSIVMAGQYGDQIANRMLEFAGNIDGVFNVYKAVANRWKSPSDPGAGFYGSAGSGVSGFDRTFSTRYINGASFLTVKNISLGYTIPLKQNKYIRSIRFYASGQQLFVFTKYPGINPEVGGTSTGDQASVLNLGNDYATYPVPRTFTFGANFNF
ncbi:TonB-dependent receptor [Mucilaginibacter lappiensis]|uniref:TonB-linked SusC/RagA family outer membrane protein n=1 Tax=Mucilaginibacter lappiensis TaxID=354630 RepID=A0A841JJI5_9SPHI|nr:TonB-dependent receptor [Mucilaginibacter lappiensis]MBB6131130.1 TonB-linked SusC/RagA family outer membrane protein [Mucilaginibacter lappiensis]